MKGKGNDGSGNIKDRDDWETPDWLFDNLNDQYNFTVDCCATKKNTKCNFYFSKIEKIKLLKKYDICWMNPPFSKVKLMFEHFFRICKKGVAIYRCDNLETRVWQDIILKNADWIFVPKGRISYQCNPNLRKGRGCRFPSTLIGKGVDPVKNIEGTILFLKVKPPVSSKETHIKKEDMN